MPERKGHGGSGHSRFDHMPTEELENILRLDFQLPEGEGLDADTLLYITEIIAGREASSSQPSRPDAEAAWQDLLTRYLPDGTTDLLGDGAGSEPVLSPGQPSPAVRRHSRGIRWMIRIAGVAAILAVLFFVTTITAYALGYDVWGTIAKWSNETFSFASTERADRRATAGPPSNNLKFSSLQEALDYFGIEETITPTWIPERFVLESVDASENAGLTAFSVCYSYENDVCAISVLCHEAPQEQYAHWQKDDVEPTTYEVGGVTHYLMTNMGRQKAVWMTGNCECNITGDMSKEELLAVIDSIYETSRK